MRDGKTIYSRGYGLADLEHGAPITPQTVFHIASVSKQFTAFAIHLLAKDGKLSLDDDIRKYLPDLHDFGKTITIRHLIHHTSGLRDQWNLLVMAGWRFDDVITESDVFNLLSRQKELNFAPGETDLYCNSGYTLLGIIVKRVSGKSLREFSEERIFGPLKMGHTHFHDEYGFLVKNRAHSYMPQSGGKYRYMALSYSNVGATSLFTTIEDLARWDQNFYDAKVGGSDLISAMQMPGKLSSGKELSYASALVIGKYRGLKTVEHAGGDAGFRTNLLRFPDQHFSVIVLCNAGEASPGSLSRHVADVYLEDQMEPMPGKMVRIEKKVPSVEVKINPQLLDAYVGDYQLAPGFIVTFMRQGDQLMTQATGQSMFPAYPLSETGFFLKAVDAQVFFDKPGTNGKSMGFKVHQGEQVHYGRRMQRVELTPEQLQVYTGVFYSEELDTLYTVSMRDGKLSVRYPRGEVEAIAVTPGNFTAGFPLNTIQYQCGEDRRCDRLTISNGRVLNLKFNRVDLKPVGK